MPCSKLARRLHTRRALASRGVQHLASAVHENTALSLGRQWEVVGYQGALGLQVELAVMSPFVQSERGLNPDRTAYCPISRALMGVISTYGNSYFLLLATLLSK